MPNLNEREIAAYEYGDVIVPNGKSGDWEVSERTVSKFESMMSSIRGGSLFHCPEGTYKTLTCGFDCVMSNTPMELRTNRAFVRAAEGHVHINGLGLGVVLLAVLMKLEVESVTVVEKSPDVISLVAPSFASFDKLTIIQGDALEYKPPSKKRFGAVWHDIWNGICEDNLDDMRLLHRRWGRKTQWQGSWARELIR
jgi:hypothetical protein